jgi:RimJ/RimL family protein N-acetyltransferase
MSTPVPAGGPVRRPRPGTWALAHGMHRLELTVMAHNERAHALYERMGFVVEGRRRECLLVNARLVDELYMAKLLPYPAPAGAER